MAGALDRLRVVIGFVVIVLFVADFLERAFNHSYRADPTLPVLLSIVVTALFSQPVIEYITKRKRTDSPGGHKEDDAP